MDRDKKRPGYYKDSISLRLMLILLVSVASTYSIAVIFYPDNFSFTYTAFSHLGKIRTESGLSNIPSFVITGTGMLICALVMFNMARAHTQMRPSPNSVLYAVFSGITSTGFALMVFPCDVIEVKFLHIIGSAFVFGGLYFLLILRLYAIRGIISNLAAISGFIIFNTLIFIYFWRWLKHLPDNPLYQKLALILLIAGLYFTCRVSRKKGERPLVRLPK